MVAGRGGILSAPRRAVCTALARTFSRARRICSARWRARSRSSLGASCFSALPLPVNLPTFLHDCVHGIIGLVVAGMCRLYSAERVGSAARYIAYTSSDCITAAVGASAHRSLSWPR
jgi:hypothetical protein